MGGVSFPKTPLAYATVVGQNSDSMAVLHATLILGLRLRIAATFNLHPTPQTSGTITM